MAITLKRQLNDEEKEFVISQHGRICFANGHEIPVGESVHFDHIRAFASGGATDINNIAPMCPQHNRAKGTLPLFDFRAKLRLEDFFSIDGRLTLHNLLEYLKSAGDIDNFGLPVSVQTNGNALKIESPNDTKDYQTYLCPVTGWEYFYATLPVELIDSDDDQDQSIGLQPRYLILDKVFQLFRHFQQHPVLQPSLGRIIDDRIRLFDGQHKAAAVLWNGHKELECKIYVDSDIRILNDTNISAHDRFAQTRFYSSIMVSKLGSQFGADFDTYRNLEDEQAKSEANFMDYLRNKDNLTRGEVNKRFRSFLYNSVLKSEDNRLAHLISDVNYPTREQPITMNALTNSLFASFLYRDPVYDNMTTDSYMREAEVQNMVNFMNMFNDMALQQWNPKAPSNDETQRKLERIIRSRFMKAWAELVKDAVCAKLRIYDTDDRERLFYRKLSEDDLEDIRFVVDRLIEWKLWSSPSPSEIDQIRLDNDAHVKEWLRDRGAYGWLFAWGSGVG